MYAHSKNFRETEKASRVQFRTKCFESAVRPRIAFILTTPYCRELERLLRRHRTDFLPVLKNSVASRSRVELCETRPAGRAPAGAFVGRVNDLVDAARELTSIRSAFCNRIHLFRPRIWIDREVPSWMRSEAARFWEPKCIAIGDQDCISRYIC